MSRWTHHRWYLSRDVTYRDHPVVIVEERVMENARGYMHPISSRGEARAIIQHCSAMLDFGIGVQVGPFRTYDPIECGEPCPQLDESV